MGPDLGYALNGSNITSATVILIAIFLFVQAGKLLSKLRK